MFRYVIEMATKPLDENTGG